jgi:hypothetical protein
VARGYDTSGNKEHPHQRVNTLKLRLR